MRAGGPSAQGPERGPRPARGPARATGHDTARDDTARDDTARDDTARDDTALDDTALDDTARDEALRDALRPGAIQTVFQPIVDLETGEILGYEALSRGPQGSPLERPEILLRAARESGRIAEVDWCCRRASFSRALDAEMGNACTLFVNIEADVPIGVPDALEDLLDRVGSELRVVLEVTEAALVSRPADLLRLVEWSRDRAWGVALDDVGANPLSLALMPFLEPDVIKLDLSLVQGRPTAEIGAIVSAVLSQSERSGATIVAEGIETEEHLEAALAMGATMGQGWLFGRPGALPAPVTPATGTIPLIRAGLVTAGQTPFSVIRSARPVRRATKAQLIAISTYLEEQAVAWPEGPVIMATFQDVGSMGDVTVERYSTLAGRGSLVVVLGSGIDTEPAHGVVGVTLPNDHRLGDEWSVVVVGPHYAGALVARERAAAQDDDRWDFAITHDRDLVVAAGQALLREAAPPPPQK